MAALSGDMRTIQSQGDGSQNRLKTLPTKFAISNIHVSFSFRILSHSARPAVLLKQIEAIADPVRMHRKVKISMCHHRAPAIEAF
jgi:hypothetical protein